MPDANTAIFIWAVIAATLSIPDWKFVIYGWQLFLPVAVAGYLIGSIPFGLLLTRFAGHGDIRQQGSGSIGATNVLRTGSKTLAGLTLLLDAGKGYAVAALALHLFGPDIRYFAAIAVVLGHMFSIWLKFRGGKGVATAFGVLLALSFPAALASFAVWLLVAFVFRYSSLAALAATLAAPVLGWFIATPQVGGIAIIIGILIWIRHAANIRRLLRGKESRIKLRSAK